ncbi:MarR family transcriptional regulator [Virgibacillus phasianinus]|uniref:MarR family transcriptional regulator n=1 Tax=Virgibacillus phasianinus TaxID=2017483 RepID=A0A220U1R7_9BACI|nr:MarR family transcriptional regulator [Virgibacillus phasianinus]ASK61801.1 MarR family transcriptional regulator [Virgibacillus phasianinus]
MTANNGKDIAELFREINALMKKRLREQLHGKGLTPPQMMTLHLLSENEPMRVGDLSDRLKLAPSTVSSILDRLEKNNFVIRCRNKNDRRIVEIYLSKKAEELQDSFRQIIDQFMQTITAGATEQELHDIRIGLQTMRRLLMKEVEGE